VTSVDLTPHLPDATIPALIAVTTERFAPRTLLVADGQRLTYAEVDSRSRELAKGLLADGVGKGDHVGILMANSIDWVVTWFAVARIGAVGVPLNTFSPAGELGWLIRHADLRRVIAWTSFLGHDYQDRIEEALPGLAGSSATDRLRLPVAPNLQAVQLVGASARSWARDAAGIIEAGRAVDDAYLRAVEAQVTAADPAVVVYTSGSTADPKGCIHSQGTIVRQSFVVTSSYVVTGDDVMFSSMPFFWIGGLVTALHACQHHGATLVTQPSFDAGGALELIETERATIAQGWPQQGKTLAEHPDFATRDVSSVRRTSMPDFVPADRRPPPIRSDSLGMTETCGSHTNFDPYVALPEAKRGTFGPSVPGFEHKVVDPGTGVELAAGGEGEICIRGSSMMLGLQGFERSEVFDADGWLHTGDAGRLDDEGWLYYTGRLGDLIKTGGGANVTPVEVERALMAFDEVLEAYVVGAETDHGPVVAAAVVPKHGQAVDADELRIRLKADLSAYKIPKVIVVYEKVDLPFTTTGKLKKRVLADQIATRLTGDEGAPS
jgi:acyl-CoA synthetase (AMP-forming)/AMP-acid ligase II